MRDVMTDVESVLQAVFDRLPSVFPEFGWKARRGGGWVATARHHTKAVCGARPSRVVCLSPAGFYVFGQGATHWLAYLAGGAFPRGPGWREAVDELARRALLVPVAPRPAAPAARDVQGERAVLGRLLQGSLKLSKLYPGKPLAYLQGRGISDETMSRREVGYVSSVEEWLDVSRVQPHQLEDVTGWPERAGVWNDRVVGAWRGIDRSLRALWGRSLSAGPKYLVCGTRPALFGHDRWLGGSPSPEELVVVEGVLNVLELESQGVRNVCALGGTHLSSTTMDDLVTHGVRRLYVVFDGDVGGDDGLMRLWEQRVPDGLDLSACLAAKGNPSRRDLVQRQ